MVFTPLTSANSRSFVANLLSSVLMLRGPALGGYSTAKVPTTIFPLLLSNLTALFNVV